MNLKFITCSGANENTSIEDLVNTFSNIYVPEVVLGVQVSGKKASFGTARYWWLRALYGFLEVNDENLNVSLHVNQDWVERFIKGDVPQELDYFLRLQRDYNVPFIKTVQLNFKLGRESKPDVEKLLKTVDRYKRQRFILSCSRDNIEFIEHLLAKSYYDFWLLYDDSFGEGVKCENWKAPLFDNVLQGYAGGLSPENILTELNKIEKVVGENKLIFVDAEGKLKGDDGKFSIKKAEKFVSQCVAFFDEKNEKAEI